VDYQIPAAGHVTVEIFNVAGKRIDRLVHGYQKASWHARSWDTKEYSSGIYFCRLTIGTLKVVKKGVVIEGGK
jgi:hypothetical protein